MPLPHDNFRTIQMIRIDTDVAVIGAGTAGLAAYRAARAAGARAVLIEGGPYGTTCARVGCMPSKLLIAAAEAVHETSKLAAFGVHVEGKVTVDGQAVMARVKRERDRFVGFVLRGVDGIDASERLRGYAKFTGPFTLQVDDHTEVAFSRAVIATGSSPAVPPFLRGLGDRVVVNDDVFEWDILPRAVAVFGPGVIGLELGQALSRLGVQVRMFGVGGAVGPFTDPAVREYATRTFASEFPLDADAQVDGVERAAEGVLVRYRERDGTQVGFLADYVIAATGRTPNVRGLALERTGIALDTRGVPRYDMRTLQCGASHIFVAGDANADLPLLHEAADEGRIAGDNASRFPRVSPGTRRAPLAVVFSDPQLAVVGRRFAELTPGTFVTGAVSFEDQGRSRVMLRNRGLLHVYADVATGRLVGAEMIGPDAEHLAHLLAWVVQLGLTVPQILALPFYHPVVEEGLRTALRDADERLAAASQGLRVAA
jgi:dihydrolipoamide dehydrogenase